VAYQIENSLHPAKNLQQILDYYDILFFFFFKQKTAYEIGLGIPAEPLFRSAADLPPSPTKSSNLSETAEVPACNVPSRSPLPALAIAPETKLGTASSGLGTLEP